MYRECRGHFPHHHGLAIPTCITAPVWRTCHDTCWDPLKSVAGKTFPFFPGHCATHKFNYLVRVPWGCRKDVFTMQISFTTPKLVIQLRLWSNFQSAWKVECYPKYHQSRQSDCCPRKWVPILIPRGCKVSGECAMGTTNPVSHKCLFWTSVWLST